MSPGLILLDIRLYPCPVGSTRGNKMRRSRLLHRIRGTCPPEYQNCTRHKCELSPRDSRKSRIQDTFRRIFCTLDRPLFPAASCTRRGRCDVLPPFSKNLFANNREILIINLFYQTKTNNKTRSSVAVNRYSLVNKNAPN
jgi:hypothetical protein